MAAKKSLFQEVELYEVDEIARLAGVSAATIRQCIRHGRLRAQRIGRRWKVTRENALEFLNASGGELGPRSETSVRPAERPSNRPAETVTADAPRREAVEPDLHASEARITPRAALARTDTQPTEMESMADGSSTAQLLFLKPEDLDRLVSALAIHVDRMERTSERREAELRDLVERLTGENERLKNEMSALREEQRLALCELAQKVLEELNSPERNETERFRFRWLQDQLTALAGSVESTSRARRGWWPFR